MNMPKTSSIHYLLTGIWVVFMISLSIWWLIFGFRQADAIQQFAAETSTHLARQQKMLIWEGTFLVGGLLIGGAALIYFANREAKRRRQSEEFFAAFTHDLKTSLASIRLQIESLQEDIETDSPLVDRLVRESVSLQMQLENSLYMSNLKHERLFLQPIALSSTIGTVHHNWPDLEMVLEEDPVVSGDLRALESVVRNIVANAVVHGNATRVDIGIQRDKKSQVQITFEDNGSGANEAKPNHKSPAKPMGSTGMGLYISNALMEHMGGSLEVLPASKSGFRVALRMREAVA